MNGIIRRKHIHLHIGFFERPAQEIHQHRDQIRLVQQQFHDFLKRHSKRSCFGRSVAAPGEQALVLALTRAQSTWAMSRASRPTEISETNPIPSVQSDHLVLLRQMRKTRLEVSHSTGAMVARGPRPKAWATRG